MRAGRQSERYFWLRYLREPERRRSELDSLATLELIIDLRLTLLYPERPSERRELAQLEQRLNRVMSRANVKGIAWYNAACFWSLLSARAEATERQAQQEKALWALHRARRIWAGFPSLEWLQHDPDLAAVRLNERFKEVEGWLERVSTTTTNAAEPRE